MPKNGSRGVVNFLITPEMSPLARVVAVGYMERRNVSIDSYIMSIKPHCRHAEFEVSVLYIYIYIHLCTGYGTIILIISYKNRYLKETFLYAKVVIPRSQDNIKKIT